MTTRAPMPPARRRGPHRRAAGALALCALAACSSPPGGAAADMTMNTTPGDGSVLAGAFQVSLIAPDAASGSAGYTAIVGKVYDGPSPSQIVWTAGAKAGACALSKPRVPFCNTPCGGSAVCVDDDKCQKYPTARSVGEVRVTGVKTAAGASDLTLAVVANTYQVPAGTSCPFPAFTEGAPIEVSASGGAYAPFVLRSAGIAPLALQNDKIELAMGQAVTLRWNAPAQAGGKVHVKLDISHHGGSKGMIECDAEDSGSLELPATLVTELLSLGAAGFPTVVVTRKGPVGSAVIAPGRVELTVSSEVEHAVVVPGIISCTDSSECPMGKTCQADLTCK